MSLKAEGFAVSPAVAAVSPTLGRLLLSDFGRGAPAAAEDALSARDRCVIALACVVANDQTEHLETRLERAIASGVSKGELGEVLVQLAFYAGFPCVLTAGSLLATIFEKRPDLKAAIEANPPATVERPSVRQLPKTTPTKDRVAEVTPSFIEAANTVLYGKIWENPILSKRDRSLVVVTTLVAMHRPMPLAHHVERALANGVTKAEIGELIAEVALYAGFPVSLAAGAIVADLFERRPEL